MIIMYDADNIDNDNNDDDYDDDNDKIAENV